MKKNEPVYYRLNLLALDNLPKLKIRELFQSLFDRIEIHYNRANQYKDLCHKIVQFRAPDFEEDLAKLDKEWEEKLTK